MNKRKPIKLSEARIIIYISQVPNPLKYAQNISQRLDIDYRYCLIILNMMVAKGWLKEERSLIDHRKKYYQIADNALVEKAKKAIMEVNNNG